jgi:tetratricopeptide (TPR) repeat protein
LEQGVSNLSKSKQQYIKDAIRYYQVGRYQAALWAFEQAIQIDPNCVKALHGRGIIFTRMREYEKALKAFEQALKLAPDIAKIRVDMAGVLLSIYKDYQKAGLLYKKAAELDKRYKAVYHHKARQLFDRAHDLFIRYQFHGFQEERNEAITAFQQVLLFDPTHEGAKQALSELQNTRTSVTYGSSYFFDDFYSYQSQPSRSQLEREAMENNQWDLPPSIHPANCRCAQCWEP